MSRSRLVRSAALMTAIASGACGVDPAARLDDDPMPIAMAPPAPQLQVTGSLRNIHLSWTTSAGALGYHVYRSADGVAFDRRNGELVTQASFDDAIESPAGDGVLYRYKVTAVAALESSPSNVVQTMHGTRLPAESFGLFTLVAQSPYVAEGTSTFGRGGVEVTAGTKLYVLDGAVLDLEIPRPYGLQGGDTNVFSVAGLLRATASAAAPARFTAHQLGGGQLGSGSGFVFEFSGVPYQPSDGSGSVLEHVEISNLASSWPVFGARGSIAIVGSGIRLANVKISATETRGFSRIAIQNGGWLILESSYLHKVGLAITSDVRSTPFRVTHNVFRRSGYSLVFDAVAIPALDAGQFEQNDLNGTDHVGVGQEVTGAGSIPVGNNYWGGGRHIPSRPPSGTQPITFDFHTPSPELVDPPAAGPDW